MRFEFARAGNSHEAQAGICAGERFLLTVLEELQVTAMVNDYSDRICFHCSLRVVLKEHSLQFSLTNNYDFM